MLRVGRVRVFGCGHVHDNMIDVIGKEPTTMRLEYKSSGGRDPNSEVIANFGRSAYTELPPTSVFDCCSVL